MAVKFVGGAGAIEIGVPVTRLDSGESATEFVAMIENLYVWSLIRPGTIVGEVVIEGEGS